MSQSQSRLFQKWLEAGDDRTFGEWLDYRRQCVTQERQQRKLAADLFAQARPGFQREFATMQQLFAPNRPYMVPANFFGNSLRGIFG